MPAARSALSAAGVVPSRWAVCSGVSSGLVGALRGVGVVVIGVGPSVWVSVGLLVGLLAAVAFEFVHRVHGHFVFAYLSCLNLFRVHGGHLSSLISPIAFWRSQKHSARGECTRDRGIPQAQRGYAAKALVQRGMVRTLLIAKGNGVARNKPRRPTVDGAYFNQEKSRRLTP